MASPAQIAGRRTARLASAPGVLFRAVGMRRRALATIPYAALPRLAQLELPSLSQCKDWTTICCSTPVAYKAGPYRRSPGLCGPLRPSHTASHRPAQTRSAEETARRRFTTSSRARNDESQKEAHTSAKEGGGRAQTGTSNGILSSSIRERVVHTPQFPPPSFPKSFGANQVVPLDDEMQGRLDKILSVFPDPVRFAFAYGSGVFAQSQAGPEHSKRPETKDGKKMVDVVMAVTHPEHWHAINMQVNKRHYSLFTRMMGGIFLGRIQRMGAGLWYHPYIQIDDELVKYGVMDVETLCNDLLDWDTLYVSGRMHKPVALAATDSRVRLAQQVNLASALRTSLLLLPEKFTEVELYTRIASLSYTGDFRMSMPGGENANKVRNIVLGQREFFRRLYGGLLRSLETVHVEETRHNRFQMIQDRAETTRAEYASKLPLRLREKLQAHYTASPDRDPAFLRLSISTKSNNVARKPGARAASLDPHVMQEFWRGVVRQPDFETVLLAKISDIVRGPARLQSLKGIYTAGVRRTLRYVLAKIGKVSISVEITGGGDQTAVEHYIR